MSAITHHIPENMLAAYTIGNLPHAFSVVVASHISLCDECRASYEALQALGGAVMEGTVGAKVSDSLLASVLDRLDDEWTPEPIFERSGIFPGPVVEAMQGREPTWKRLGMGVRQDILFAAPEGSVRLLYIPPGQAVPDHGHNGQELTLVLQGSFSDETGHFRVGDLEVADEYLEHTPISDCDEACICLAATDASLKFNSFFPRILQPIFKI